MSKFTTQQKKTVDQALGILNKIIDCYKKLPKDKQDIPEKYIKEIQRITKALKSLNNSGQIDFESKKYTVLAETDRHGIHLNDKFGNNYKNNYKLPADYNLDDCEKGYFYDLWHLLEILIHENYHYEHHSGLRGFNKVALIVVYSTVGNVVEGLSRLFSGKPYLKRKYIGHEHETYSYTYFILSWISSMLTSIWLGQSSKDPCLPCVYQHISKVDKASKRQDPYEWVR